MSGDGTQPPKRGIWACPTTQTRFNGQHDVTQVGKISVVQATAANQFPNPFDGIEFRAIGRQKMQTKVLSDLSAPVFMETGMMIASIVGDDHSLASSPSRRPFEFAEELPAGLGRSGEFGTGRALERGAWGCGDGAFERAEMPRNS